MQNNETKRTNETKPLLTVSDFDVEKLLELVSVGKGIPLINSRPLGYLVIAREPIEAVSCKLLEELSVDIEFRTRSIEPLQVKQVLKNLQMDSGLSLYNEIIISVISAGGRYSYEECRDIFSLKMPEPQGFLNTVVGAAGQIKFESGESLLLGKEDYLRVIDRRIKKIRRIDREVSEAEVRNFVFAMRLVEKLSASFGDNIGDIERVFIEAVVSKMPVDVLFFKCPRLVQYLDYEEKNRLDVLTHCETVTLQSRIGERVYEGDEHMISYFRNLTNVFAKLNITIIINILVEESDVEKMYPVDSRVGHSNLYDAVIVPRQDVKLAKMKAAGYTRSLSAMCGLVNGIRVGSADEICGGTDYEKIRTEVFEDAYKSGYRIIRAGEFERAVEEDLERYGAIYPNYRREHAKYKVANKIADMRALSAVLSKFANPLVITKGPFPVTQAHLLVGERSKDKRRIIFADPERDALVNVK